jgi:membrane protein implicated in regulation of membrane protease activity
MMLSLAADLALLVGLALVAAALWLVAPWLSLLVVGLVFLAAGALLTITAERARQRAELEARRRGATLTGQAP